MMKSIILQINPYPIMLLVLVYTKIKDKLRCLRSRIFVHYEQMDGVYLGEDLVISQKDVKEAIVNTSKKKDQSNLLVVTPPTGKISYFAGFAWGKGGQATNSEEWNAILKEQAEIVADPLKDNVGK